MHALEALRIVAWQCGVRLALTANDDEDGTVTLNENDTMALERVLAEHPTALVSLRSQVLDSAAVATLTRALDLEAVAVLTRAVKLSLDPDERARRAGTSAQNGA